MRTCFKASWVHSLWVFLAAFVLLTPGRAFALQVTTAPAAPMHVGEAKNFSATATGSGPITYTWDFGDGTRTEALPSPEIAHTYNAPGHYTVIAIARDETGVKSASFVQLVHYPLSAAPPSTSSTIVFDERTNRVCTANPDHKSVTCLDGMSLEPVFEVALPGSPTGLALDQEGLLWVACDEPALLMALDESGQEAGRVAFEYGAHPFGVAAAPQGELLYVPLRGRSELALVSSSDDEVVARVATGLYPAGIAVSGDGERVFVSRFLSDDDGGEISEIDPQMREVTRTHHLAQSQNLDTEATSRGVPNYLRQLLVSPDGRSLWVPSKQDNIARGLARDGLPLTFESTVRSVVSRIDLLSNEEVLSERLDLNNRALGLSGVLSPRGDYLFVALTGNNGVHAIDAYSGRIVGGRMELGLAPDGLALSADGRLYVHSFLSRTVHVLDVSKVLSTVDFSMPEIAQARTTKEEVLPADVLLGKQVFYNAADPRMGADGYISCAACHLDGYEDGRVWDFTDRGEGLRNTTSLLSKRGTGQGPLHWSANFDEVQDFEHDMRGPFAGTGFLSEEDFASGTVNQSLGEPKAGLSVELDGLARYVESLDRAAESPHRDPDGSLTEEGWKGHALFSEAGCAECHSGSDFTDSSAGERHDVGTLKETSGSRLGEELDGIDTPTLRGLWETAPYLHDGSATTLLDVLNLPGDAHGNTSSLTEDQKSQLAAYLLQIDNTPHADEVEPEVVEPDVSGERGAESDRNGGCALGASSPRPGTPKTSFVPWLLGLVILLLRRGAYARWP